MIIGHYTQKSGWVVDASVNTAIDSTQDYTLGLTLKGSTANVTLKTAGDVGYQAIAGHVFNASTVDGSFGLFSKNGPASFDNVNVKTNDPVFVNAVGSAEGEVVSGNGPDTPPAGGNLNFNTKNVFDVNADGVVTTRDLLAVVSDLQLRGARELTAPALKPPYVDVNMDGRATIADAARLLQELYRQAQAQGEGEGEGEGERPLVSFGDLENPQRDEAPPAADASHEAPGQTVAPIAALAQLRQAAQQRSRDGHRGGALDQSLEGLLEEIAQDVLLSWRG